MAPGEEQFEVGSLVKLADLGNAELDGAVGKVLRSLGRGRWAVTVEGKEGRTVVNEKNMERYVAPAEIPASNEAFTLKPTPYHIVGTWDDWEPHEMHWNTGLSCFEYTVRLGEDAVESFKFILDGDWDSCIYPDAVGASCHTRHFIHGPDNGGVESEWIIGGHPADRAFPGAVYKVRAFASANGQPLKVEWQFDSAAPDHTKIHYMEYTEDVQADRNDASEKEAWSNVGSDVEAAEKAARARLELRLQRAAQAEMQAITDGDEGTVPANEQARADIDARLAENRRRYVAHCGTRKERVRQTQNTAPPAATPKPERPQVDESKFERRQGKCMECNVMTEIVVDVGGFCCQTCFSLYQEIRKDGWDGSTLIHGKQAAQHAQRLVDHKNSGSTLTISMARRQIMNQYPQYFKRSPGDKVPPGYQLSTRQREGEE